MKQIFLLIILIFTSALCEVNAQRFTIIGNIEDKESKIPTAFVNVVIVSPKDSLNNISGISTDISGFFKFKNVKRQRLILKASYVGYLPLRIELDLSEIKNDTLVLKDLKLQASSSNLVEVSIEAKIERFELSADKLIMNIDESLANSVTNAFDLLKTVPGVIIDKDDNLTLNGKSGILFQYNSRDLKLPWEGIVNMLKGMTPDQVEKFEIISNPSAKYDSEGTAGIINIKLKTNKNYGINGSVGTSASYRNVLNNRSSVNLNYVDNKWTSSLNYSNNNSTYEWESKEQRYTAKQERDTILIRNTSKSTNKNNNHNLNFSADYLIDSSQSVGISIGYSKSLSPWIEKTTPYLISSYPSYFSRIDSSFNYMVGSKRNSDNFNLSLSYIKKLDTNDANISADLYFSSNSSLNNNLKDNKYFIGDINETLLREEAFEESTNTQTRNFSARVDYFKPLTKTTKLELGIKSNLNFNDNSFSSLFLENQNGNSFINDTNKSNHFKYFENINSIYSSFSKSFSKNTSLRLGIRFEQTNTQGYQYTLDSTTTRSYFNVFPNINFSHAFSMKNRFNISYSYRISRPWSSSLNPFLSKSSDYYYSKGNPMLEPQFSHSIYLSQSFFSKLYVNVSYSYTKDNVSWLSEKKPYPSIAVISSPYNLRNSHHASIGLSFNHDLFKWWNLWASASGNYNKIESKNDNKNINNQSIGFNINASTNVTLPKKWRINAYWYYSSSSLYGVTKSNGWQGLSVGLNKTFFKESLSLGINISGLLEKQKSYSETIYNSTISKSWRPYLGPTYSLNLRYKFGKYYQNKNIIKPQKESFDDRTGGN
ncbi:MAG: TonB-dependent receptor [Bacteroidetes bacterium]|nr:TonB-dependent receptor [Bacteroidota bacterium]